MHYNCLYNASMHSYTGVYAYMFAYMNDGMYIMCTNVGYICVYMNDFGNAPIIMVVKTLRI